MQTGDRKATNIGLGTTVSGYRATDPQANPDILSPSSALREKEDCVMDRVTKLWAAERRVGAAIDQLTAAADKAVTGTPLPQAQVVELRQAQEAVRVLRERLA